MKYRYITIEREYGSGGTKVSRLLGEKLGLKVYGQELLDLVAEETQVSVDVIQKYEERATNSLLYSLVQMYRIREQNDEYYSEEEKVFAFEKKIINRLADQGPGIFVGHCAGDVLKNRKGVLRIFITSDPEAKTKRIAEDYGLTGKEIENTAKRFDRKRATYYTATTGKNWKDFSNYDLVLNTGTLGLEKTVEILENILSV